MPKLLTHKEYKNKYLGQFKKENGIPTSECVWNSKLYSKEVLGVVLGSFWGSAIAGWENKRNTFDPKIWDKIINTPTAVPQEGDIMFWGRSYWKNGHVAVFDSGNVKSHADISQNSTGKDWDVPGDEIILKTYSYRWVVGWYRLKPKK
jgi:hypothetical protein